ncbi:MAG: Do family serine endopeptidase [Deltaproteobacteria bacterium]|nr:Do family serine endopeptidase [Deltaproteobacteria bacterium]
MQQVRRMVRRWWWLGVLSGILVVGGTVATSVALAGNEPAAATPSTTATAAPSVVPSLPSFAPIVERLAPSVVSINVVQRVSLGEGGMIPFFFGAPFGNHRGLGRGGEPPEMESRGAGSGVIIDAQGYILTNAHVVKDATEITVQLGDGASLPAETVGLDEPTDLALLRVHADHALPAATFGDSDALLVGDWVLAIGNPFGLEHTVTTGIVSAKERRSGSPDEPYGNFIQTDASINPGNSGGPLFDLSGRVVGINTAINAAGQGIGFAIPSNMAKSVVAQLEEHGRVERSWIGVTIQTVTPELAQSFGLTGAARGALVAAIQDGSPATEAGLRVGDIILRFGEEEIGDAAELPWLASTAGIGNSVRLQVFRDGTKRDVTVRLARMPEDHNARAVSPEATGEAESGGLGIRVEDVPAALRERIGEGEGGALVVEVDPTGAGADHGLQQGDVIEEIDGHHVADAADLAQQLRDKVKTDVVRLLVRGEEGARYVGVRLR